jgi:cytochrome P450
MSMSERAQNQFLVLISPSAHLSSTDQDSAIGAIQSFVYHMIQDRTAWPSVRKEIDDAQARGLCLDRIISFHDADQLPYFKACIKEALRIFSPTTMGLPRVAPKDGITIAGRHFQEGTILSVSSQ